MPVTSDTPDPAPDPAKPKPLDPKIKAKLQLSGDLPAGEKPMSKAQLEKALGRELVRHELRWVPKP
jgi:hypothetical protein